MVLCTWSIKMQWLHNPLGVWGPSTKYLIPISEKCTLVLTLTKFLVHLFPSLSILASLAALHQTCLRSISRKVSPSLLQGKEFWCNHYSITIIKIAHVEIGKSLEMEVSLKPSQLALSARDKVTIQRTKDVGDRSPDKASRWKVCVVIALVFWRWSPT